MGAVDGKCSWRSVGSPEEGRKTFCDRAVLTSRISPIISPLAVSILSVGCIHELWVHTRCGMVRLAASNFEDAEKF